MNDAVSPIQTPPPKPFSAEPAATPGGCGKPLLIGCGVLAILLGIAAVFFVVKAKSLLAYALDKLQAEVVSHLPEDVGDAERRRLEAAFDATLAKIKSRSDRCGSAAEAAGEARRRSRERVPARS